MMNIFIDVSTHKCRRKCQMNEIRLNSLREEIFAGINFREVFFRHFAGINFRELGFTEDFAGINFRELCLTKDFAGINFRESAFFKDFAELYFMVLRTISVEINTFLPIQMTK